MTESPVNTGFSSPILTFGELLWDLLPESRHLGGAPFNLACRLRELGADARIASRVGNDALGADALATASRLGMDVSLVQRDGHAPTGTVEVRIGPGGSPEFVITSDTAFDRIDAEPALLAAASAAGCVCYGTLAQRGLRSRATLRSVLDHARDALAMCDLNLRPEGYSRDIVEESLARADVVKLNESEAMAAGELLGLPGRDIDAIVAAMLQQYGVRMATVTFGERGAVGWDEDGRVYAAGYRVAVADTVGAGDAFAAGFVHAVLAGGGMTAALEAGTLMGACAVTVPGGTTRLDTGAMERLRASGNRCADPRLTG